MLRRNAEYVSAGCESGSRVPVKSVGEHALSKLTRVPRHPRLHLHGAGETQAGKTRCSPHHCGAYALDGISKKGLSYTKNDVRQPPVTSVRRLKSIYRSAVEVMLDYKE